MNSLSLFLLFIEAYTGLTTLLTVLAILSLVVLTVFTFVRVLKMLDDHGDYEKRHQPERYKRADKFFKNKEFIPPKWILVTLLSLGIILSMAPSEQTLYLVAGSEAGEMVVTSEEGKEVLEDVKEILQVQLEKLKK